MKMASLFTIPLILCVIVGNFANPSFATEFTITVETDKLVYSTSETINIRGNLTLNNNPATDALVAIQINGPTLPIAYRTLPTRSTSQIAGDINEDGIVDIFDVVTVAVAFSTVLGDPNWDPRADANSDNVVDIFDLAIVAINYGQETKVQRGIRLSDMFLAQGYPPSRVATVKKGREYWIWINYSNTETYDIPAVIAFTIYDSTNVPRYALASNMTIPPGGPYYTLYSWVVPDEMELGIARIYASAFSDFPQNLGWAYCKEKSRAFEVTTASGSSQSGGTNILPLETSTDFSTPLKIPVVNAILGIYTVHACSFYLYNLTPYIAYDTTTYEVAP